MKVSTEAEGYEGRLSDVLQRVRDVVRRRFLTIILVTGVVTALGIVLTMLMTPQYQGTTRIRIDPSRNPLEKSQSDSQQNLASEAIETEVTVLSSLELAREVVRRLNLTNDPEFAAGVIAKSAQGPVSDAEKLAIVSNAVMTHLAVSREKLTYIIDDKFNSHDAIKAARIANEFSEAYLDTKVGSKIGTAERQSVWFQQRLNELATDMRAADERVAQYRAAAGIVTGTNAAGGQLGTITDQQVGPLSGALASAQSSAAEARSAISSAQQQIAKGDIDAISEVRTSPTIQALRVQRSQLVQQMGEIQVRYGEKHPETIKIKDQIAGVDAQLKDEANRTISSLRADASAADARAATLRGLMNGLEAKQASNTRAQVTADSMQREADSKHAAYDKMAQMALETRQASQNSIAQAEIVDRAQAPLAPASPNKPLMFALSFIVGLAAGIATVVVQELLVSGLRTVEDIEGQFGIPVLAAIPNVRKTKKPADLLIDRPTSQFAESLRNARASLLGVRGKQPPRIIALTSALPNEGKTTTALGLARTLAISGGKTLLLDCDVRRAQMRQIVDSPSTGPGIVEVLHGEATLDEAIQPGGIDNLDHLLVRTPYFSSENLFGGEVMPKLLEDLLQRYELIVLDLPPLVGLADGRFLAALADAVALVVKWDATPAGAVQSAIGWLQSDGAKLVGAMYAMVDSSAETVGGLYYYGKKYSSYYQEA